MNQADRYHGRTDTLRQAMLGVAALLLAAPAAAQDAKTLATTVCVACHADDGNSVVPLFPKISGLQENYIAKQLKDFMSGRRRSDVMAPIVAQLKPEDVAPLAAYYSRQPRKPAENLRAAKNGFGKMIFHDGNEETGVPACVGCHQPQGAGYDVFPRVGGQHAEYVAQQLKNFAAGERSNDVSRFMRVTAKRMSDEEIKAVAEYLASLDGK